MLPERLQSICELEDDVTVLEEGVDKPTVVVPCEHVASLMAALKHDASFAFLLLLDHTVTDRVDDGHFELVYQLYSPVHNHHLMVMTTIPRAEPVIQTLSHIWAVAEFQEREIYDMFGVVYRNHPDLRRLFLEDDWVGFPLRKDYEDDFMLERPK